MAMNHFKSGSDFPLCFLFYIVTTKSQKPNPVSVVHRLKILPRKSFSFQLPDSKITVRNSDISLHKTIEICQIRAI